MEGEWDAEGFEPKGVKVASKWDDEDADDAVKENWEDEEEQEEEKRDTEKQDDQTAASTQPTKKTKKNLTRKIEEKEREEQRMKEEQEARRLMTPEERLAEKLQKQKLQEEADLKAAIETFGVEGEASVAMSSGLEAMVPVTREDYDEFGKALVKKIQPFAASQHFPNFAEELVRNVCANLSSADLKKLKNTIENLHLEKTKMEKGDKAKKNKGKGKAKLRIEGDSAIANEYAAYNDLEVEYDDFM